MTARDQTEIFQGVWMCAEPTCDAMTDIIHTKRGPVISNVLMRRGSEEIRLCLLCYLANQNRYFTNGFSVVSVENPKK